MKTKKANRYLIALILAVCVAISSLCIGYIPTYAREVDVDAENRAKIFLKSLYNTKNIEYEQMDVLYSTAMYDEENNVIAQVSIFERDDKIDYAVYNYLSHTIDEYGFDTPDIIEKFPRNEEMYYLGALNYYTDNGTQAVNTITGKAISKNKLFNKINDYKEKVIAQASGQNADDAGEEMMSRFISWNDIDDEVIDFESSSFGYLQGITWNSSIEGANGISDEDLWFYDCELFASYITTGIDNHCAPTALANMMIYYKYRGLDTLISNDPTLPDEVETFNRLRVLCGHNSDEGTDWELTRAAIVTYLAERGYSVSLTLFGNDFDDYKIAIDNDKLIVTSIRMYVENSEMLGHAVLTLGYEEFVQEYQRPVLWWTVTEYNYIRYIRVCDGWDTSNQNRYINMASFEQYLSTAVIFN